MPKQTWDFIDKRAKELNLTKTDFFISCLDENSELVQFVKKDTEELDQDLSKLKSERKRLKDEIKQLDNQLKNLQTEAIEKHRIKV
jgi:prefoldin subunit 5